MNLFIPFLFSLPFFLCSFPSLSLPFKNPSQMLKSFIRNNIHSWKKVKIVSEDNEIKSYEIRRFKLKMKTKNGIFWHPDTFLLELQRITVVSVGGVGNSPNFYPFSFLSGMKKEEQKVFFVVQAIINFFSL